MAAKLTFAVAPPTGTARAADLFAVLYREYALLARNRVNLVLSLTPMLVYLLLVNTSLSNLVGNISYKGADLPFAIFLLPMVLAMSVVSAAGTSGMALFQEELSGVSTQLWSYPMRRSRFLAGKLLAGVSLVLGQSLLALGVAVLLFDFPFGAEGWLGLLAALTLASVAFNGLYLTAAITIKDFQTFMVLTNVSLLVLVFSAPSMYTVDHMPLVLQWVSVVNPLTYAIDGMRDAAVFGFAEAWPDLLVLACVAVVGYGVAGRALLYRARDI
ncbi:ABC transporter permease [Spongiactinospora sp. TRM90649]|uniref:ABC transporter permease n=1 Tax=Spongiactinospora sp. TRM90649 TaxID=3031114 RepID=UPI0023F6D001|nr:ABC transporter permease [Spongiactinospora sp. TRM90649]MDF5759109.1 ABC transporter permease [Spongiactinospora sp. TRM90649]